MVTCPQACAGAARRLCPRAFTLIELLIVVAILAILAAIAVPNFLEAQVRSKVSRARADLRTLATGLGAYSVDNNHYPDIARGAPGPDSYPVKGGPDYAARALLRLSTPVSYLTTALYRDPFIPPSRVPSFLGYANAAAAEPVDLLASGATPAQLARLDAYRGVGYVLVCVGPDTLDYSLNPGNDPAQGFTNAFECLTNRDTGTGLNFVYDPTNGTVSVGDVTRAALGETR